MSAFAAAMDVLAADPNLGTEAVHRAGGTGPAVALRVVRSSPDRIGDAFGTALVQATDVLAVAVAALPLVEAGDTSAISSPSSTPSATRPAPPGGSSASVLRPPYDRPGDAAAARAAGDARRGRRHRGAPGARLARPARRGRGALIRPKGGGRFLAVPTGFNAARGWRGRGDKGLRVTPAQMVTSGQGFLRPFRSGRGFVWCLPLRRGEQTGRRRRTRLIAGGVAEVGTANRKGREAWARGLLEGGMVPMFLLLPQVKLAKRLDVRGAALRALRRLPGRFVAAWEAEARKPG